ncbi:methionine-rich copper-binding protein CopC [Neobacillus niacini]|uniref:copper resistance CopC family protein n=1 Tax=Neobacillus driksii TaxID=3035913 RepID=UPI00277FD947|nr:copper resistance protein CopC [Neobacillus niacini]MDQ0973812.1 methionine-rich copper-binding protein CopC [Neobacillus niacini]
MKKLMIVMFCFLMIMPSVVSAHTSLTSSNPAEGQVVTENLEQITLDFASTIEELSTMELVKNGKNVALEEIKVENKQLIGRISNPLDNGTYTILWKIIGEDGHPINGEINFSVQTDQNQSETNPATPEENQDTQDQNSQSNQTEQNSVEQNNASDTGEQADKNTSSTVLVIIAVSLVVIFGIVLLLFTGKKKR